MTELSSPRAWNDNAVLIELTRGPAPSARVELRLADAAARLLPGRPAAAANQLIPSLYAICAHAHGNAAAQALASAEGRDIPQSLTAARDALATMEALRECVLLIGLSWPELVGVPATIEPVRQVTGLVSRLRQALFGTSNPFAAEAAVANDTAPALALAFEAEAVLEAAVFGEPLATWRARLMPADLSDWASKRKTGAARVVDVILRNRWAGDGTIDRIALDGAALQHIEHRIAKGDGLMQVLDSLGPAVPETRPLDLLDTPSASCHPQVEGNGLLERMLAQLSALAQLPKRLRASLVAQAPIGPPHANAPRDVPGYGFAAVWSARGVLIHAVQLRHGLIARYEVIQPTRLNFHAAGGAARALGRLAETETGDDALLALKARLLVGGLDPCVASEVRVV